MPALASKFYYLLNQIVIRFSKNIKENAFAELLLLIDYFGRLIGAFSNIFLSIFNRLEMNKLTIYLD